MDYSESAAESLRRATVHAYSRALCAASAQIREESRAAIETSKVRIARSRMEMARVLKMRRDLVIHRPTSRGVLAAA